MTPVFQVKALVSLESGGVPTAYLSSQQTLREKRAVFAVSCSASDHCRHSCMPTVVKELNGVLPSVSLWTCLCSQETPQSPQQEGACHVVQELRKDRPSLKLLYITPEQLVASAALTDALQQLKQRGLLARFVVDEVRLLPSASTLDNCSTAEVLKMPLPANCALLQISSTVTVSECLEGGSLGDNRLTVCMLTQNWAITAGTLREPMGP